MKRGSKERFLRAGKRFGVALLITVATLIVFSKPLAVASINGYQKWVSPNNNHSCAFRVQFNKASCSGYGKRAIIEHGLVLGVLHLKQRFRHCGYAARMQGEGEKDADNGPQRQEPCYTIAYIAETPWTICVHCPDGKPGPCVERPCSDEWE